MAFSFSDNGTHPIALISGNRNPEFVYLSQDEQPPEVKTPTTSILDEKLDPAAIQQVVASLQSLTLRQVTEILSSSGNQSFPGVAKYFTTYTLEPNEEIETIPAATSERVYVAGEAGCGKSTITAKYARQFHLLFPDAKIFFFLRQDDPAFNDIPGNVMILDFDYPDEQNQKDIDDLLHGNISIDILENSLCIFDDCDNLQDKKLSTAIHKLMADVVTNGRKRNIYTVYISHLILNYAQTRVILNEANKVFMFPGCGTRQIENFLKTYGSMKTKEAEALANIKSRWVMLSRKRPRYIIHEKGIFLL